ncbi:hypothetical protein [Erythrobacter sp. HL-111]|uniref:hypothetical protein n=1 Tax=Erythrobacter sp. HL-111 TaxID=1798193 RepID=UPI0006D99747|nr:hypothetical protein [Erythrobacter sp. HL-111]KPP86656.1 MAG: hypothetical protein HLUCCO15_13000 [Erythrobacteraceae bacterium HL-111]SDR67736.1 hypothetical protein SAMN04515621_0024 [Erythrobacter sp. HL-111]
MTDAFAVRGERAKAPWHLWALALASLLWFAGGANDYVMTRTANAAYLGMAADSMGITVEEILAYFADYPLWASVCWALGVWGAVAGSLLLFARSRFARHAFLAALVGLAGSSAYLFASDAPAAFTGTAQLVFTFLIWASVIGMAWYAARMTKAGVLR